MFLARSFPASFGSRRVSYSCTSCAQGHNLSLRLLFIVMRLGFRSPGALFELVVNFFYYFGCSQFLHSLASSFVFFVLFSLFLLVLHCLLSRSLSMRLHFKFLFFENSFRDVRVLDRASFDERDTFTFLAEH